MPFQYQLESTGWLDVGSGNSGYFVAVCMLDNALITLVISTMIAGETTAGIAGTPIAQSFQPTQQGVNSAPTAYMHKLFDELVGYPYESYEWDTNTSTMVHVQTQQYASHFQISALSIQDPANTSQYTASDILNLMASILQSDLTVSTLEAQGVGIQKIKLAQNPVFLDDYQRNEYAPYLEFILTHKQIITSTAPIIQSTTFNVYEI
ncbi:MAG: hypothetical protein KGL39_23595 [Patescibacteria group bacterium]|nr:hypothetical protein [Patescibacteria group bacterium]